MTPQPRVLLDVDGVLASFVSGWLALINGLLDTEYTPEHVIAFDVCASLGLDVNQAARSKKLIAECPGFARMLPVYPGAIDGVRRLMAVADVYIVTSPWNSHPTWTHDREAWLEKHFGIPHTRVIHTSAKHVCVGDFLVDDKTSTCEHWQKLHPAGVAVQWQTPHNRLDTWPGFATNSWDALVALVRRGVMHRRFDTSDVRMAPDFSDEETTLGGEG